MVAGNEYAPIRVLFILSVSSTNGGAAQVWLNLLRGLPRYGVEPFVIMPSYGNMSIVDELVELGIPYMDLLYTWWVTGDANPHSFKRRAARRAAKLVNARAEREVAEAIAEAEPDLIYIADGTVTLGLDAAEAAGIPVVWQFHQFISGSTDPVAFIDSDEEVAAQLKRAARILTVAHGQKLDLCTRFGLDADRIDAVYNGIDPARIASKITLLSGEHAVFSIVGSVEPNKRQLDALAAFERIAPDFPYAQLAIVGTGKEEHVLELIHHIAESKFVDRIEYAGFRKDIQTVWNVTDIALNCSMSEGCSMVVAEAMASGCLVIASTARGNVELLDPALDMPGMYEGVRGLLYERGNVDDLANQMRWALENPKAARQIAGFGRADACVAFSLDTQLRRVRESFDKALAK